MSSSSSSGAALKRPRGESSEHFLSFPDPMQAEFVASCVEFKSNVTFFSTESFAKNSFNSHSNKFSSTVLVMGTKEELKEAFAAGSPIAASLPFGMAPEVLHAVCTLAESGKLVPVSILVPLVHLSNGASCSAPTKNVKGEDCDFIRVLIGCVPTVASRYNCPLRPDSMTSFVHGAFASTRKSETTVDVISLSQKSGCEVIIAAAVAKGVPHTFQTKDRLYRKGERCMDQRKGVNLFFVTSAAAQGINPQCKTTGGYADAVTHHAAGSVSAMEKKLVALVTSIQLCQRLLDAPPNLLDTAAFTAIATGIIERANKLANKSAKLEVRTIVGEQLRAQGYGGIYGVGKGAEKPPALVTLMYTPVGADANIKKRVALVGKGIIYDCGGLALKPAAAMVNMKYDMGGAAAVFCSFLYAAVFSATPSVQLSCTLCLAENAIGPESFRNDDILFMKSGKTVEVNNTDAEGRLVLGDGVFHASNELASFFGPNGMPDLIVDMATLTGAQGIGTGHKHAAIYANNGEDEAAFIESGKVSGDTVCPVVYCPEYHAVEFASSKVADMKNLMTAPNNAGISCGGHFVESHLSEAFTSKKGRHVHVDLAFPVFDPNGATGYGVALLAALFNQM